MWPGLPLLWIRLIVTLIASVIVIFLVIFIDEKKAESKILTDAKKILDEKMRQIRDH